jgi:hypothetical protein
MIGPCRNRQQLMLGSDKMSEMDEGKQRETEGEEKEAHLCCFPSVAVWRTWSSEGVALLTVFGS